MTNKSTPEAAALHPLYDMYKPHRSEPFFTVGESMTKQSFVEECDINNILRDFGKTGQFNHMAAHQREGVYADLPDNLEFQDAMNIVLESQTAFATLPSQVRSRFHNDPAEFLEFMADPANQDEAIRLGLATDKRSKIPPVAPNPEVPGQVAPVAVQAQAGGAGGTPPAPSKPA